MLLLLFHSIDGYPGFVGDIEGGINCARASYIRKSLENLVLLELK